MTRRPPTRADLWDQLAQRDPLLATEGYNACEGYRSREELGSLRTAGAWFAPAPGARVLDLGCGWGKMSGPLAAAGAQVHALDVSHEMLVHCRAHADLRSAVQAEAQRLPYADGVFDHVWSHSMLMHLPRVQVVRVIDEVARVLRPGGTACLHFKGRRHLSELMFVAWAGLFGGRSHPLRRRGEPPLRLVRAARRRFRHVELVAESFQLVPLSVPLSHEGEGQLGLLGIPAARDVRFGHLLPASLATRLRRGFDHLKRLANGPCPGLRPYAKELLLVLRDAR